MEKTETEIIQKLDKLTDAVTDIKTDIAYIKGKLDAQEKVVEKIPDLIEKLGELKNWKQIAVIVLTGSLSSILAWLIKN